MTDGFDNVEAISDWDLSDFCGTRGKSQVGLGREEGSGKAWEVVSGDSSFKEIFCKEEH